ELDPDRAFAGIVGCAVLVHAQVRVGRGRIKPLEARRCVQAPSLERERQGVRARGGRGRPAHAQTAGGQWRQRSGYGQRWSHPAARTALTIFSAPSARSLAAMTFSPLSAMI